MQLKLKEMRHTFIGSIDFPQEQINEEDKKEGESRGRRKNEKELKGGRGGEGEAEGGGKKVEEKEDGGGEVEEKKKCEKENDTERRMKYKGKILAKQLALHKHIQD